MVGNTAYPILSVCKLAKQGWDFSCGNEVKMIHRNTQSVACGLSVWCDTPWIRVRPHEGNEYRLPEEDPAVPGSMKVSALTAEQMTAHRLRGHTPYEPSCEVCQSCKGVHRHARKKTEKGLNTEIFADFGFLSRDFEVSTKETRGSFKFLALKETFSSNIGCVLSTGDPQREGECL